MPDWGKTTNEVWANEQLTKINTPDLLATGTKRLLKTLWDLPGDQRDRDTILELFYDLAHDRALEVRDETEYDWIDLRPGQVRVTDIVRAKVDAFRGDTGRIHNGRVGRVVAIRSGDIIVDMNDDSNLPKLKGVHYSPFMLDKRVPRVNES